MWDRIEKSVAEAFREAKAPDLRSLPTDSLEKLVESAKKQRQALGTHILREAEAQRTRAHGGEWAAFGRHRDTVRRLQEDWDGLNEQIEGLTELIRRKRLDERVVERLGGRGRAVALEAAMMLLIAAVLGMLVWEETPAGRSAPDGVRTILALGDTGICAIFLWEFFWKMSLAESKAWYFRRHWVDFVSSLPIALIGWGLVRWGRAVRVMRVARAARMARMLRFMRLLRVLRGAAFVFRGFDKITKSFNVKVLNRPLAATLVFLIIGGIAMGMIEHDELRAGMEPPTADVPGGVGATGGGAMLASEEDPHALRIDPVYLRGLWWSFTTVCTGGFADIHDPATAGGQLLTVLLVILGAILTGAFTAALASVLMGDDTERIERKLATVIERLDEVGGS